MKKRKINKKENVKKNNSIGSMTAHALALTYLFSYFTMEPCDHKLPIAAGPGALQRRLCLVLV